jgi:dTDP-4-dehydrorhamnose reductase
MIRIACIGRTGQTAQALAAVAPSHDVELTAAGRETLDLRHPRTLAAFLDSAKPDAVINAAAYNNVDRAEAEPAEAFAVNAEGPRALARACALRGLSLIHMSTDCVFDGTKPALYTEEDRPNPLSAYGRSKLAGEEAVLDEDPGALVVRVAWVFSEYGDNFVSKMIKLARDTDIIRVVSDQTGPPTWAPDIANALILAAKVRTGQALTGLLHVASPEATTRAKMAAAILGESQRQGGPAAQVIPVTTAAFNAPAKRPLNARLDATLAAKRLGLSFKPWLEALPQSVAGALARPTSR